MVKHSSLYVGLDTHKDSIVAAAVGIEPGSDVVDLGRIPPTHQSINKLIKKLQGWSPRLQFVYEAGPCGYWLQRYLAGQGLDCIMVSPSLVPIANKTQKTDRRDARSLAVALKMDALTPISVPALSDEAVRDIARAWQQAKRDSRKIKQRIKLFLLKYDVKYTGQARWSEAHRRWLCDQLMPHPASRIVLQEHIEDLEHCERRTERLEQQLKQHVEGWRFRPVVEQLQAFRGLQFTTAVNLIAELGDLSRFDHPKKLMAYVGLVPSEHSSGNRRRQGAITRAGNGWVRTLLVESAWAYRYPAKVSVHIAKRQTGVPAEVIEIAWQAQLRLCRRYQKLKARGLHSNKVITAIARELIGFIWSVAKDIKIAPAPDAVK